MELAPALGIAAALVGIADTVPYARDTLRGSTRPHRRTWLVWSVLAVLVCLSQKADALAAGAVGAPDLSLLLYPVYFCLVNAGLALLIHQRRLALALGASPAGSSGTAARTP